MTIFNKGDLVLLKKTAIDARITSTAANKIGTVVGYGRDKTCVRLEWWPGNVNTYHVDFLEKFVPEQFGEDI